jgi:hypothetical protein
MRMKVCTELRFEDGRDGLKGYSFQLSALETVRAIEIDATLGYFWKVLKLRPLKQSTKRDKRPILVFIDTTEFSSKKQLGHVQKCY